MSPRTGAGRGGSRQLGWLLLLLVGCGDRASESTPPLLRSGRYGTLRDLVLLDRAQDRGGPFFLDRFEATRGDFAEFAATTAGKAVLGALALPSSGDAAALPMARIDLLQARSFAQWRRCRLPRTDEWAYACSAGGVSAYPWGNDRRSERANTSDLGVFVPLPVGTFESGRSGNGPYDLIGNVAEWTETVPGSWFHSGMSRALPTVQSGGGDPSSPVDEPSARDLREVRPAMSAAMRTMLRRAAMATWRTPGAPMSPVWLVAAAGDTAPREVVGSDYASAMGDNTSLRAPTDRSDTLGVRVCTTPRELLQALAADVGTITAEEQDAIARFCRRDSHAPVLRAALQQLDLSVAARTFFAAVLP